MRKITREAVNNFNNNLGPFKKANTEVEYRALIDIFDHIHYMGYLSQMQAGKLTLQKNF